MLNAMSVKNFKGFAREEKIKLAPITLIYGPNSSGKSSIIQAIMLLKQSITRPSEVGGLVSTGEYVDLGTYSSMVNEHDTSKDLEFSVEYKPSKNPEDAPAGFRYSFFGASHIRSHKLFYSLHTKKNKESGWGFTYLKSISTNIFTESNKKSLLSIALRSKLAKSKSSEAIKNRVEARMYGFQDEESRDSLVNFLTRKMNVKGFEANAKIKTLDDLYFKSDLNFATPSSIAMEDDIKTVDGLSLALSNAVLNEIAKDLQDNLNTIAYLGPLRIHPARLYAPKGDQSGSVGKSGENAARLIYEKSPEIGVEINKWFARFEIPYELSALDIGSDVTGSVISLQLKDKRTGVIVGPSDVGFGIGQLLPILVEGIVRKNSSICVEQPEIHLHPRLQAHLANFMIETCKSNQWIVETHSESLILRLQNKIKDGSISPEDVSVIYIEATGKGSQALHIPLDKDGDFTVDWPDGFFDERFKEVFGS